MPNAKSAGGAGRREGQPTALSWTASSVTSFDEFEHDHEKGKQQPTGRVVASVDVHFWVRDFAMLDDIGAVVARQEALHISHLAWRVDKDNAAWARVRADAIAVALQRARDYANAIGGSITRLEQVADAGLLADSGQEQGARMAHAMGRRGGQEFPTLDPDVQELRAAVDVRAIASVPGI